MEKKKRKYWKIPVFTLIALVILFILFVCYGLRVNNRVYKLLTVTSNSMYPVFEAGDLIMIVRSEQIEAGDIITFHTKDGSLLTHRVMEIKADGEIVTKGDANETIDKWDNWKLTDVKTVYLAKIPKVGYVVWWFKGIFNGNNTGAYLIDTCNLEVGLDAQQFIVEQDPESEPNQEILSDDPSPSPSPPEPSPTNDETTNPSPDETSSPSPEETATTSSPDEIIVEESTTPTTE